MRRVARSSAVHARAGFTVFELAVSAALLCVVLGSAVWFQMRVHSGSVESLARGTLDARVRRALDRAARELTGADGNVLTPDPTGNLGTDTLAFRRPTSVSSAGNVTLSAQLRLAATLDPSESENGVDDDGDDLIDERNLVLTTGIGTAAERSITLCGGVTRLLAGEASNFADDNGNGLIDESGFNVQRTGDLLMLRLTLEQPVAGGRRISATLSSAVVLRN